MGRDLFQPSPLVQFVSMSKSRSPGEKRAVDGVDNRLRADLTSAEESTVETFDSVLASSNAVEFEIDVALGVRI